MAHRSQASFDAVRFALRFASRLFGQKGIALFLHSFAWRPIPANSRAAEGPMQRSLRLLLQLRLRCPFCRATHLRFVGQKGNVRCTHSYACVYAWRPIPANSRAAEGPMRIFPGFSRSGKCDSRERSESERRRSVARVPQLQLAWNSPLRSPCDAPVGSSGKKASVALLSPDHFAGRWSSCTAGRPAPPVVPHRWPFCANRLPFLQKAAGTALIRSVAAQRPATCCAISLIALAVFRMSCSVL